MTKDVEKDLSGNFKAVCLHLLWKKSELEAHAIRKAIKGIGTDEAVLMEILCTQTNEQIEKVKKNYSQSEFTVPHLIIVRWQLRDVIEIGEVALKAKLF